MSRKIMTQKSINLRFNTMTIFTYIIGIILIARLFSLQIVHGAEYREQSNTRLARESIIKATRGNISDASGNPLITSTTKFNLELYKNKITTEELNNTILNIINLLDKYKVSYTDSFPIKMDPIEFTIEGEELENWKKDNKIDKDLSAEDTLNKYKDKYDIKNEDINDVRKIISIRYKIEKEGFSSTKSLVIAKNIPREVVAELSERSDDFPGININEEPIRNYNQGTLASHILGYASTITPEEYKTRKDEYSQNDIFGHTGIEAVFEEYLKGKDGIKQIDMSVDGTITAENIEEEATAGSNIILTIDSKLQKVTENALAANVEKIKSGGFGKAYPATGGSAVVMNVKTGEVLAMASYPEYNPESFAKGITTEEWNGYINNTSHPLINKSIQSSYAPGSIYKMVTGIAGLESGAINLNTRINDTGIYKKYNKEWKCWYYTDYHRGHGSLNVIQAIQQSCNYFFYETVDRMGIETLDKYARFFGLGTKTGIELPSETAGTLASKEYANSIGETWGPGYTINAGIGQGLNRFTPLQIAKYISMIANGGKKIDVSIVKSIQRPDGSQVSREEIKELMKNKYGLEEDSNSEDITLDPTFLNAIKSGMKAVTEDRSGTAYVRFKNFDIDVGGKTGSAEAGKDANNNDIVNAWFAAFAPYDDPEIAVVVLVENGGHGNYTAEAVRDIMAEYFGMNAQNIVEDMTATPYTEMLR